MILMTEQVCSIRRPLRLCCHESDNAIGESLFTHLFSGQPSKQPSFAQILLCFLVLIIYRKERKFWFKLKKDLTYNLSPLFSD